MKQILIPTDFSESAWNALFTALKLYAETECNFILFNAYEPRAADLLGKKSKERLAVLYESMETNSETELDKILKYLSENHTNSRHHFEKAAVANDLLEGLEQQLQKRETDLIVMGTQGAGGAREVFLGSNTVRVIRHVRNCPVLAVPEAFNFQALKKVLFPTDFTRPFSRHELELLLELLTGWQARLMILHLTTGDQLTVEQRAVREALIEKLQGISHSFHQDDLYSDLSNAIGNFALDERVDMIALIHYQHSFMERLTREPVVKQVAFSCKVPFLILPDID